MWEGVLYCIPVAADWLFKFIFPVAVNHYILYLCKELVKVESPWKTTILLKIIPLIFGDNSKGNL